MVSPPVEKKSTETLFYTVVIAKILCMNHLSFSSEVESNGTRKEYMKSNLKSFKWLLTLP